MVEILNKNITICTLKAHFHAKSMKVLLAVMQKHPSLIPNDFASQNHKALGVFSLKKRKTAPTKTEKPMFVFALPSWQAAEKFCCCCEPRFHVSHTRERDREENRHTLTYRLSHTLYTESHYMREQTASRAERGNKTRRERYSPRDDRTEPRTDNRQRGKPKHKPWYFADQT